MQELTVPPVRTQNSVSPALVTHTLLAELPVLRRHQCCHLSQFCEFGTVKEHFFFCTVREMCSICADNAAAIARHYREHL